MSRTAQAFRTTTANDELDTAPSELSPTEALKVARQGAVARVAQFRDDTADRIRDRPYTSVASAFTLALVVGGAIGALIGARYFNTPATRFHALTRPLTSRLKLPLTSR